MKFKFFRHLHTLNKHRWEVFRLCCKVGIPFQGLVHDLSKFSYTEFSESVKYYVGNRSPLAECKRQMGYSPAWLHHFGRNKHHYEYWYDYRAPIQMPIIPFKYMLEMVCDRISASKTYKKKDYTNSSPLEYLMYERDRMVLNDKLKDFLEEVFTELADKGEKILNRKHLRELYQKHTGSIK